VDTVNVATLPSIDTRTRLLACAIEVLDREGVAGLGIREVARRAGVSHNAPSRHFPGGYRDLCTAVAADGFARLAAALNGALLPDATPLARLEANGRAYVAFGLANRGVFELMWRSDLIDFSDAALTEAATDAYASLRGCVAGAQAAGWCAGADTDLLAATCWSWAQGLTQLWSQGALPGPVGSVALEDVLRNGFLTFAIAKEQP
jgi:AcrR family transcriptional regulator